MKMTSLDKLAIEKALIPRFRFMSFILLFLSCFTLTYALLSDPYLPAVEENLPSSQQETQEATFTPADLENEPDFLLTKGQRLNLYLVSAVFGVIGLGSLFYSWRRKTKLLNAAQTPPDGPQNAPENVPRSPEGEN